MTGFVSIFQMAGLVLIVQINELVIMLKNTGPVLIYKLFWLVLMLHYNVIIIEMTRLALFLQMTGFV